MRKIVLTKPYEISLTECEIPEPQKAQVRIKVMRIGICGSDPTIYRGLHPYVSYPLVPGHEISGVIDKVGEDVPESRVGERVTVIPHIVCGECDVCKEKIYNFCENLKCTGAEADGAMCDYFCISSEMAIKIPDEMNIDDAALVEPACVAYHGAKRANPGENDTVLVVGAGPIGVYCMQSCFALGAKKVYIADMDSDRLKIAESLGATGTIDVSKEDLAEGLSRLGAPKVTIYYDCVGEKGIVLNNILKIAHRGSKIVVIGVLQKEYIIPLLPDFVQHELALFGTTMYVPTDYVEMIDLMSKGIIRTKETISHRFTLEDIPSVLDMLDKRKEKTFKILIDVND
ncbi:MAG: alcohol dehydrogenase catalytic domain-containing protein [Clostridia bacterium]|nr:alcohol dehydrogenase catalytic domain-containing protein [Clostridia bacterium]